MALAPALDLREQADPRDFADSPPAAVEAEQSLLGALLYEPSCHRVIGVELLADHFFEPFHGRLYQAILETLREGLTVEVAFLAEEFKRDRAFNDLGGVRYLADLIDRAPAAIRAPHYARHILDIAHKRRIIEIAREMGATARAGHTTALEITALGAAELAKIDVAAAEPGAVVTARSAALAALEEIETEIDSGRPRGVRTGLECVDVRIGGLLPESLITIGARPSMGKTSLIRSLFYGAAKANPRDLFLLFALETPARQLSERALSAASHGDWREVDSQDLNRSKVKKEDLLYLRDLAEHLPDNLIIDDRPDLSLGDVWRTVWQAKARGNLRAVGIDYVQLMKRSETRGKTDAALIGEITSGLKRLARMAQLCMVLCAQLSRGVDNREDKRPQLSDLRESGSIEQDSDAVLFPFREAYYVERQEPDKGTPEHASWTIKLEDLRRRMDVIVAKNRHGALGFTRQRYVAEHDFIEDTD